MLKELEKVNKDFGIKPKAVENVVHTGATILSFPHIFKTATFGGVDSGKYSCVFMISKKDEATLNALKAAFKHVLANNAHETLKGANAKKVWSDFRKDGDKKADEDEKHELYRGFYLIKASSKAEKFTPEITDAITKTNITKESEIYGGVIARGHIILGAYNYAGRQGITAYLHGITKLKDHKKFGGSGVDVAEANKDLIIPDYAKTPEEADDLIGDMSL